jgi:hypothetical protein
METHTEGSGFARWLMIVVVVGVLTLAVYSASSDHGDAGDAVPIPEPVGEYVPHEVGALLRFVDSAGVRSGAMGHESTAAGVRYVAAALGTVATSAGLDIGTELETVREYARHIERDPRPRERTAQAFVAFNDLASLLGDVQQARFRGLEPDVANVRRAASSLQSEYRLVDQSDVVEEFFSRAAATILAMNHALWSPRRAPTTSVA